MRVFFFCIGASLLVGSLWLPRTDLPDGGNSLEGWWVAMAGLLFGLIAGTPRTLGRPALVRLLWVVAASVAFLGLTRPRWLQHLWVRGHDLSDPFVLLSLGIFFAFAVVSLGGLRRMLATLRTGCSVRLGVRSLVFLGAWAVWSVHATLYVPRDNLSGLALQLGVTALLQSLLVLGWIEFGARLPEERLEAWGGLLRRHVSLPGDGGSIRPWDGRIPWILALWTSLFAAVCSRWVMEGVPHIPDGVAYHFQAQCLAEWHLAYPAPKDPSQFPVYLITTHGDSWYACTPFGWPLVLALGVRAGVPWLVNPLLGGLAVLLAHGLVRRLADRGTAHALAFLMATSPWLLWLSASWMTHALTLVLLLGGWWLLVGGEKRRLPSFALAGFFFGYLVTVRPLEGVCLGALSGLWALVAGCPVRRLVAYAAGCAAGAALTMPYNAHFTGSPFAFPINEYLDALWYPGANALRFGPDVGNPPERWGDLDPHAGHGWRDVLYNTNQNLYNLNFELTGWVFGGLLLPALHLIFGRRTRTDWAAISVLAFLSAAYSLYWFSGGPDYGARYWYPVVVPMLWLNVRGLTTVTDHLRRESPRARMGGRVTVVLLLLGVTSMGVFMPWRAVAKYDGHRGFHRGYLDLVSERGLTQDLILVTTTQDSEFGSAFLANHPALPKGRPIFVRDPGHDGRARVLDAWPRRRAWQWSPETKELTRLR